MSTQIPSELESFHQFLTDQLAAGGTGLSPEESLEAFRAHQRDLARLKRDIQPAVQRFQRGEAGRELDYDAVKQDVTQRLTEKGITD